MPIQWTLLLLFTCLEKQNEPMQADTSPSLQGRDFGIMCKFLVLITPELGGGVCLTSYCLLWSLLEMVGEGPLVDCIWNGWILKRLGFHGRLTEYISCRCSLFDRSSKRFTPRHTDKGVFDIVTKPPKGGDGRLIQPKEVHRRAIQEAGSVQSCTKQRLLWCGDCRYWHRLPWAWRGKL